MTKFELAALGLDENTIRAVQKFHGRDMAKLEAKSKKAPAQDANTATREAVKAMLPMIQDGDNLKRLLREANFLYYQEGKEAKESAAEEVRE